MDSNNTIPLIAFTVLIAAQFLAVIYFVHHHRAQSSQDAEDQKPPKQPARWWRYMTNS